METIEQQQNIHERNSPRDVQRELLKKAELYGPLINKLAGKAIFNDPYSDFECAKSRCDMAEIYEKIENDIKFGIGKEQIVQVYKKEVDDLCSSEYCDKFVKQGLEEYMKSLESDNYELEEKRAA